jgi:hypothetical protein
MPALNGDVTLTAGSSTLTIANSAVVDNYLGTTVKPACRLASTSNIASLSGLTAVDGVTPVANDLILLTAQTTASQNGPWLASSGGWSRPTWYPASGASQAFYGCTFMINEGTVGAGQRYYISTSGAISIDSTSVTFTKCPSASSPTTTQGDMIARGASADQRLALATIAGFYSSDGTDLVTIHPQTHCWFYDDFLGAAVSPYAKGWRTSGSGGVTSLNHGETNAPGIMENSTQTVATNSRYIDLGGTSVLFGGGRMVYEWRIRIPTLSDGTDTFKVQVGIHDSTTGTVTDGVWFEYSHSVNSGQWVLSASSNSTASTTSSTSAPSANTWYKLKIDVNAAATLATYYVDGTSVGTVSGNIPTGSTRTCSPSFGITKSVGTTARLVQADYFWLWHKLTTAR